MLRFPFTFGVAGPAVAPPAPPAPPFWTNVTHSSLHWIAHRAGRLPRFEHIFPQESGADQQFTQITESPFGVPAITVPDEED